MPDTPSSGGISVGDAVLTFLGDTTDLERAWTEMEENSTASATRTVNEVLRQYDELGIQGSARLDQFADEAQVAFQKLSDSGVASMSDLIQAERAMLQAQVEVKRSLGEAIPPIILERIESLKLQYIGLTGTVAEFDAAQTRSAQFLLANAQATDQNSIALKRQQEAINAEVAAFEREIAVMNEASAAKAKNAASGRGGSGAAGKAGAAAEEEEGALAGGVAAIGATATQLALYAGIAAVAGSLAESVKQALAFDAAFTELTTVIQEKTPQSAEVIQMLKQQLLALPPTLGNITDLTHGVYQALSAGVPAAEAVKVVAQSATFAKAALTDMETSVKLITASMNAYGMTARDVDHITGALMATIQVGVLRGPQLAESLGRVLPVAANLKVSLADVLGAASALTAGGLSADESMTALRQVLSAIEKPSSEAKKAMAELGGSFADIRAEIASKGLGAGLSDLGAKIKDNTTLTTELFGNIRALTGILGLTGPQAAKYAEYTKSITEAYNEANLAQLEFNKINESQSGQLKTMGNLITNDFVKAWQTLTPIVNGSGKALYDIFVQTGTLKVAVVALAVAFLTLGVVLSAIATIADGLRSGIMGVAYAFEEARYHTHAYTGSAQDMQAELGRLHDRMASADADARRNVANSKDMLQAFDNLIRGVDGTTKKSAEFEAAQLKLAQAQDKVTEETKKMSDASSAAARVIQDQKDKAEALEKEHEKLAKAAEKTTKAMEQYANSHSVSIAEELLKNVDAAQKFADAMRATNQPIASQNAALINLNIQLGKLKELMNDKRSVGQTLFDIGNGGKGKSTSVDDGSAAIAAAAAKNGPLIKDPLVDAFNAVLDAEKKLGIQGPTTLAKLAAEAEEAAHTIREAWLHGAAGAEDVIAADAKVEEANKALANSLTNNLKTKIDNTLEAEKTLGIEGTQAMIKHRNEVDAAFTQMEDMGVENVRQLQQAELKALTTDRDLKLALGQPIPAAMSNSIDKLTKSLKGLQNQVAANKKEDQSWYSFWNQAAPSMKQDMNQLADMGTQAFQDLSKSFGSAVHSFESGQKSLGAAVEEAVSSTLESLSGQAAAYALYYTGLGLAAAASGDEGSAGEFFVAAAEMAAVAVIAGATGMALGSKSSSSGSGGAAGGSSISSATQAPVSGVNVQNVQRFGGGGLVTGRTLAMIGDSKSNSNVDATEAVLPLDDEESMSKLRAGLGSGGGDTHFHIDGVISSDTLGDVMDQMSAKVKSGKTLVASHANRVVKKS